MPLLITMLLALVLLAVLFASNWDQYYRIQRNRRIAAINRYNPRRIWRKARKKDELHVTLPTIRDFILTLQLSLSLSETLAGALVQAGRQFGERGDFGKRLSTRIRSQLQVEPEQVIRALAEDFKSEHLGELAERLEMAHEGGLSYSEAVEITLDDVEEEIRIMVEKDIERAPVMLTIPMIIGVFFAALALLGYPLLVVMFNAVAASTG